MPMSSYHSGRQFVQIPGPTNVPERVLRAMAKPTIDHRSPEFSRLGLEVLEGLKEVFQTSGKVIVFPSSGTGAWEAALVNTLSPGDKLLMFDIGQFAAGWREMATRFGLEVDFVPGDWRHGVDPEAVERKLGEDREHRIKAVCVVHNETSTGVTSRVCRGAPSHESRAASGAAAGRYHFVARFHRLSSRRVGSGRNDLRIAKRPDAAARPGFQRR